MNRKAAALGMSRTVFKNSSGLPHSEQISTARDLGVLAQALYRDFNGYFDQFSKLGFDYQGNHYNSHNNFLRAFQGALGLKTGFTCRAGYNLVAAAKRDGRMIMGVLLGETTAAKRDAKMRQVIRHAFAQPHPDRDLALYTLPLSPEQGIGHPINAGAIAEECLHPGKARGATQVSGWSVVFGLEVDKQQALNRARELIRAYKSATGAKPLLIPQWARNIIYRVAITGLSETNATSLCLELRTQNQHCIVLPPKAAQLIVARALATMEWIANQQDKQE